MNDAADKNPVRIAVIGAGLVGHRHVAYVAEQSRCELTGVVDPDAGKKELALRFGAPYYDSLSSFLEKGGAEAVIVATPNDTHAAIGIECAQRGLHLLVEKPVDADPQAAAALVEAARRTGVKLLVGQSRRFNEYIETAKTIIDKGELGRVTAVSVLWALRKPPAYYDAVWRREAGGGPILINLIHDVDNLRYLFGEITQVYAEASNAVRMFTVEDTAVCTIRFACGLLATAVVCDTAASPYNFEAATGENPLVYTTDRDCYRIFGTRATLSFPDMIIWDYADDTKDGWGDPIRSRHIAVEQKIPLKKQLLHFCDVIRRGAAPRCSGEDALKTLEVIMAVKESVRTGRPVALSHGKGEGK